MRSLAQPVETMNFKLTMWMMLIVGLITTALFTIWLITGGDYERWLIWFGALSGIMMLLMAISTLYVGNKAETANKSDLKKRSCLCWTSMTT